MRFVAGQDMAIPEFWPIEAIFVLINGLLASKKTFDCDVFLLPTNAVAPSFAANCEPDHLRTQSEQASAVLLCNFRLPPKVGGQAWHCHKSDYWSVICLMTDTNMIADPTR
jgi:hypothetical protein